MKNYWQKIQLTTALGIALLSNMAYSPPLQAKPVSTSLTSIRFTPPPPPPDRGAVGNRGGAASRGCNSEQTVTALVPIYEQTVNKTKQEAVTIGKVWGLTDTEHPSLLFFVPYKTSSIANIEFVLQKQVNNKSQTIYRTALTPAVSPGIISVSLPETIPPLEAETMYRWFLKVKVTCNPQQPSQLDYVEGWIQRINKNPALTELLKQAQPQQKVKIYAEKGIWYDAIATLVQLRLANPNDRNLLADWTSFLNSVGLESLANQPLTNCCKANNK
ncbi:MAG: DUF928 domain-containing protein [Calothrix sp. CSU_2_0]|nr:DUF928 domain-containing protein [Calothrix sp. CSU_2_0]